MRALSYKNENFKFKEPFEGLFTQGMVCHETYKDKNNNWISPEEVNYDGKDVYLKNDPNSKIIVGPSESMSKSKKNVIDPENIIENYGADAVRLFILSDSPPEKDVQWSDQGMVSAYKFVQKIWLLHSEIKNKIEMKDNSSHEELELKKFTNKMIYKISDNLESFSYNVIIANMYETYNFLTKYIKKKNFNKNDLLLCYKNILTLFSPVIPHLVSECFVDLKIEEPNNWPETNKKYLEEENINMVVQINGKKRGIINVKKDISEKDLLQEILNSKSFDKFLKQNNIKKQFYVKNRLINFLI